MPADGSIAAVVLAAGASQRFGKDNKLLARIDGGTLIERVVNALAIGGATDIVVVTGHDRAGVETALRGRARALRSQCELGDGHGLVDQCGNRGAR